MSLGRLTLTLASDLAEGEDIREIKRLNASKQGIVSVDVLSPCIELTRLDLSHNSLTDTEGIVCCKTLTWLDLSHNQLDSLVGIQSLTNLTVLRASNNTITKCGDLSSLRNLKALILNNNQLSVLRGLSALRELNTLVLSHNYFESLLVERLTKLTKLSLSHNSLRTIPNTQHNADLRELRLNENKISSIPQSMQLNARLTLLDLGNNKIRDWSVLNPLQQLTYLKNLNLKGNEVEDYQQWVLKFIPSLRILDGRRKESDLEGATCGTKPSTDSGGDGTGHPTLETTTAKKKIRKRKAHDSEGEQKRLKKHRLEQSDCRSIAAHSETHLEEEQSKEIIDSCRKFKKRKRIAEMDLDLGSTNSDMPSSKKPKPTQKGAESTLNTSAKKVENGESPKSGKGHEMSFSTVAKHSGRKRKHKPLNKAESTDSDICLLESHQAKHKHSKDSKVAASEFKYQTKRMKASNEREDSLEDNVTPVGSRHLRPDSLLHAPAELVLPGETKESPARSSHMSKAHSGVVAVKDVKSRNKRKKQISWEDLLTVRMDMGTGQESTWT